MAKNTTKLKILIDEYNTVELMLEASEDIEQIKELGKWKAALSRMIRKEGSGVRALKAQGLIF